MIGRVAALDSINQPARLAGTNKYPGRRLEPGGADAGAGGTPTQQRIHGFPFCSPNGFWCIGSSLRDVGLATDRRPCRATAPPSRLDTEAEKACERACRLHSRGWATSWARFLPKSESEGGAVPGPRPWVDNRLWRRHMFHPGSDGGEDLRRFGDDDDKGGRAGRRRPSSVARDKLSTWVRPLLSSRGTPNGLHEQQAADGKRRGVFSSSVNREEVAGRAACRLGGSTKSCGN